ncbi:vesicle soluble NSF attachment protein receptor VTI2, putative [Acanthamoeba castellanii str. Neff]|uniref:Vesicle soluble NSF attachment protein receptor VTI2, putative n=1 Tax=Acanthamoeba castellanii (strain ATCC 30010 / Neff) TaxID=1257118 RepID=L8HGR7_ACACF|nr:vesicle soluble NSF attachment protein receptor VTI2, putative [Acanthamoeba castellanii str. Neff]ELR24749.1 vesicle soluble NSF attachment protein receptor VTI2, putative [Acanthamoeba castellanii str. Neff]
MELNRLNNGRGGVFSGSRDYLNEAQDDDDDLEAIATGQRARLLRDQAVLDESSDRLARAQRLAQQNEEIGVAILDELGDQRETLKRAYDKVFDVNDNLSSARKVLMGMSRRAVTNKIILLLIMVALVGGIAAVVYLKWVRKLIH